MTDFLLIIGPAPQTTKTPVVDYVSRLAPVQEKVKDRILIVPRIYTYKQHYPRGGGGKERTRPAPAPSRENGMVYWIIKKMFLRAMEESGLSLC